MQFGNIPVWKWLNTLLLSGIFVLLLLLLIAYGRNNVASRTAAVEITEVRREVSVGRFGMHNVEFDPSMRPPSPREMWRDHGVQPQEWDRVPPSPGMDMAETPRGYVLAFSLPGVRQEDIQLLVTGRFVTVQAVLRNHDGGRTGDLLRRVQLPAAISNGAPFAAQLSNGVLRVCVSR